MVITRTLRSFIALRFIHSVTCSQSLRKYLVINAYTILQDHSLTFSTIPMQYYILQRRFCFMTLIYGTNDIRFKKLERNLFYKKFEKVVYKVSQYYCEFELEINIIEGLPIDFRYYAKDFFCLSEKDKNNHSKLLKKMFRLQKFLKCKYRY